MTKNSSPIGRRDILDFYLKRPNNQKTTFGTFGTFTELLKRHIDIGELDMSTRLRKKYEGWKLERLNYPFAHSLYKLEECSDRFERSCAAIISIMNFKNGTGRKEALMSCTPEDIHIYLKREPDDIAWRLGYHIIYGIDGLKGDGVDPTEIKRMKVSYSPLIEKLVDDCDRVGDLIRTNIGYEYNNFKYGQSDILDLIMRAKAITDGIINEAQFCKKEPVIHEVL